MHFTSFYLVCSFYTIFDGKNMESSHAFPGSDGKSHGFHHGSKAQQVSTFVQWLLPRLGKSTVAT